MRFRLFLLTSMLSSAIAAQCISDLIITGVIDGPRDGGVPKAIELMALTAIADLSEYCLASINTPATSLPSTCEFTFPAGSVTAGTYLHVATESPGFLAFFGFSPTHINGVSSINGNDAIVLFHNNAIVDFYGENVDGTGTSWEYSDGWAYRNNNAVPTSTFDTTEWTFSGPNALDSLGTSATNGPVPFKSFTGTCGTPSPPQAVVINEIRTEQPSTDNDEYFELKGSPGQSLDGMFYIVLGDGAGGSGVVESVTDLSGKAINSNGYFLVAKSTFTLQGGSPDYSTTTLTFENNDNVSHLLVRGFTGSNGLDLDTNDDGVLDVTPWTEIVDSVGLKSSDAGKKLYSSTVVGPYGGAAPGHVFRCPDGAGSWSIGPFDLTGGKDTPGTTNDCDPTVAPVAVKISEIQGNGSVSPLVGQTVIVQAVVVGDFQNGDIETGLPRNTGGFFLQEEDSDADQDPLTSEGIFVYEGGGSFITDVVVGDLVSVQGTVTEFNGETQITASVITIDSSGNLLPSAAMISLPADLEQFEGMRVNFPGVLTVTEQYQLDRYNEIVLVAGARPFQYTQTNIPDAAGYAAFLSNLSRRSITYDDGEQLQNRPIANLDGFGPVYNTAKSIRMGDTIADLSGVLSFQFSVWRVRSITDGSNTFTKANPRPTASPSVGGTHRIVSFNVLNYFSSLGDGSSATNPACNAPLASRGANNAAEFDRQTQKLVSALVAADADIVGLLEIQNCFGPGSAIGYLVDQLNIQVGTGAYQFVDPGRSFVGSDAISVAFIYKTAKVSLKGPVDILDSNAFVNDPSGGGPRNRPAVTQSFDSIPSSGTCITLSVNHFKSKGSACSNEPAADVGAGNCNAVRVNAASQLISHLNTDPTGQGCDLVGILGDLNTYAKEDPIKTFEDANFANLEDQISGAYSYVFDGQLGTLDYVLANSAFLTKVTGVSVWHINADEADALDYNLDFGKDPTYFDGTVPFRASDHDPIFVGIDLSPPASVQKICRATTSARSLLADSSEQKMYLRPVTTRSVGQSRNSVPDNMAFSQPLLRQQGERTLALPGFFTCENARRQCNGETENCGDGKCVCKPGYILNKASGQCEEDDECKTKYPCPLPLSSSFCVDYDPPARFKCGCRPGYKPILPRTNESLTEPVPLSWRPETCVKTVVANECLDPTKCNLNVATCATFDGGFNCTCFEGTVGDGLICTPSQSENVEEPSPSTDMCGNTCDKEGPSYTTCGNRGDGYGCVCLDGFRPTFPERKNQQCRDINECREGLDNCDDENGVCVNIPGSFVCVCKAGFTGSGRSGECTLTPPPTVLASSQPSASPNSLEGASGIPPGDPVCLATGTVCSSGGSCCSGVCT